jgi:LemA protein
MENNKFVINVIFFVLLFMFLFGNWIWDSYNHMVVLDENVSLQYANLQTAYERKADLIPNLVTIVKQYTSHEDEVFTDIADARAKLTNAKSIDDMEKADNSLSQTLKTLFAVVENYPNLKANENFIELQNELIDTENTIKQDRENYNNAVRNYNIYVRSFPNNILAKMFGFDKKNMFVAYKNSNISIS